MGFIYKTYQESGSCARNSSGLGLFAGLFFAVLCAVRCRVLFIVSCFGLQRRRQAGAESVRSPSFCYHARPALTVCTMILTAALTACSSALSLSRVLTRTLPHFGRVYWNAMRSWRVLSHSYWSMPCNVTFVLRQYHHLFSQSNICCPGVSHGHRFVGVSPSDTAASDDICFQAFSAASSVSARSLGSVSLSAITLTRFASVIALSSKRVTSAGRFPEAGQSPAVCSASSGFRTFL